MSSVNDGGPAFPRPGDEYDAPQPGMSLRDWFAGQALVGELIWQNERSIAHGTNCLDATGTAYRCYAVADSMLAARQPKKGYGG